jgi:uncharacterized protein (DUF1697 family)
MALVVFLRGINVGGHRRVRTSVLARDLSDYGVVNVGAAGTFVVCKPVSREKFRAELLKRLPFEVEVMICDGRDLIGLEAANPFGAGKQQSDVVHFVSVLSKPGRLRLPTPIALPSEKQWFLQIVASKGPFVFGAYRRHMKTIAYLGQMDKLLGGPATTRNWNTVMAVVRILKERAKKKPVRPSSAAPSRRSSKSAP